MEAGGRNKKVRRTAPKSENVYLKLLVKVQLQKGLGICLFSFHTESNTYSSCAAHEHMNSSIFPMDVFNT